MTPIAGSQLPRDDVEVRGVPAAVFEEGGRLELYSGQETIVIFGDEEDLLFRAADALSSVNAGSFVGPGDPLPAPAPAALEGELAC